MQIFLANIIYFVQYFLEIKHAKKGYKIEKNTRIFHYLKKKKKKKKSQIKYSTVLYYTVIRTFIINRA